MSSSSRYQRTVPSLASLSISYSCLSFFITFPFPLVSISFFPPFSISHSSLFFLSHFHSLIYIFLPFPFLLPQTIGNYPFPYTSLHPLSCFNSYFPDLSVHSYVLIPCFAHLLQHFLLDVSLHHLSLVSQFLIHNILILISPPSLRSLSISSSSLPRISFHYPLFPHLALVSQFLIHYFLIFSSTLNSSSPNLLSHPLPSIFFMFFLIPPGSICFFLNPSLLSSFSSSLCFLPSSVFFAPFFQITRFPQFSLVIYFFPFCSCRMRRAERCRPLAAPWRPFSAASSAASWRSTPPSTTSTSDARAICWRATDRCPTTTAITSLFW
jgi:hypothetical protein